MTEWNDDRLDDLSDRVDRIETKMDAGFARLDAKVDKLQHSLMQMAWAYGIGMLGFAGALLGLIAMKF